MAGRGYEKEVESGYGAIHIEPEIEGRTRRGQRRVFGRLKWLKQLTHAFFFLLTLSLLLFAFSNGPAMYSHYKVLSVQLNDILDGNYNRLLAGPDTSPRLSQYRENSDSPPEPLVLTSFSSSLWEVRYPVMYEDIPEDLKKAILATEDRSFFSHNGFDLRGITRAMLVNLRYGQVVQGGSTLTQQLVKTLIGRTEREYSAKFLELILALGVDWLFSKEEIIEAYCNSVYLGRIGPFALHGFQAAARHLLQKELSELSAADCALLAGLIRSPNPLSPLRHPRKAIARAETVLNQMQTMSGKEYNGSYSLTYLESDSPELLPNAWYYQQVDREFTELLGKKESERKYDIFLALDPQLQRRAQLHMNLRLKELAQGKGAGKEELQAGLAALDMDSGGVQALIGGKDYRQSQFNRAVDAKRQIGSLVKPFIYLSAMEKVQDVADYESQLVDDLPIAQKINGRYWRPANYDKKYLGTISWRRALAESRNTPAVRVGYLAGLDSVRTTLMDLGINERPPRVPALFLGAVESSPLKMAAAYRAIGDGGNYQMPYFIEKISCGQKIVHKAQGARQILQPSHTRSMVSMLQAVMTEGTGRSVRRYALKTPVAGKTGTSNDLKDGWFAGFSSDMAMAVWVGRDSSGKMGYTGAGSALPIWAGLMKSGSSQTFFKANKAVVQSSEEQGGAMAGVKPEVTLIKREKQKTIVQQGIASAPLPVKKPDLPGKLITALSVVKHGASSDDHTAPTSNAVAATIKESKGKKSKIVTAAPVVAAVEEMAPDRDPIVPDETLAASMVAKKKRWHRRTPLRNQSYRYFE